MRQQSLTTQRSGRDRASWVTETDAESRYDSSETVDYGLHACGTNPRDFPRVEFWARPRRNYLDSGHPVTYRLDSHLLDSLERFGGDISESFSALAAQLVEAKPAIRHWAHEHRWWGCGRHDLFCSLRVIGLAWLAKELDRTGRLVVHSS